MLLHEKLHPHPLFLPGQRIIRTVLATWLCMGIYYLRGKAGLPFFGVIAAMQCITPYAKTMRENGKKRITGHILHCAPEHRGQRLFLGGGVSQHRHEPRDG